jgi:hypothetical protein
MWTSPLLAYRVTGDSTSSVSALNLRGARMGSAGRGRCAKYEWAAIRWLERVLAEGEPRLPHFAEIKASLAKLGRDRGSDWGPHGTM